MSAAKKRPPRFVLDSGGLTALTGRSIRARHLLEWLTDARGAVRIPAAILIEATTGDGARDAEVNRVLGVLRKAGAVVETTDELGARRAARVRFLMRGDDGIDAIVAASAAGDGSPATVLTSDPRDLERLLANASNVTVTRV